MKLIVDNFCSHSPTNYTQIANIDKKTELSPA